MEIIINVNNLNYQIMHRCLGTIELPAGHLKASANSGIFDTGTFARNLLGE